MIKLITKKDLKGNSCMSCSECERNVDRCIEVDTGDNLDPLCQWLCEDCLKKALALIRKGATITECWYHGTSEENYKKILACGYLQKGTYITNCLESAICYGGPYVFKIPFYNGPPPNDGWQHRIKRPLYIKNCCEIFKCEKQLITENETVQLKIRKHDASVQYPGKKFCKKCKGRGQINDPKTGNVFKGGEPVVVCPDCNGYGVLNRWEEIE